MISDTKVRKMITISKDLSEHIDKNASLDFSGWVERQYVNEVICKANNTESEEEIKKKFTTRDMICILRKVRTATPEGYRDLIDRWLVFDRTAVHRWWRKESGNYHTDFDTFSKLMNMLSEKKRGAI